MKTERNKGWRRHHKQRMIRRAHEVLKIENVHGSVITEFAVRRADNIKNCSCGACSRRWPSHRQNVMDFSAREQVNEWGG